MNWLSFTPGGRDTVRRHTSMRLITRAFVFSVAILLAGNGNSHAQDGPRYSRNNFNPYVPIFTDAQVKIAETADISFTAELLANAVNYEPLLLDPKTQVHMGFWSGPGNHGSLARLLDSIN